MIQKVHESHLGINKCIKLARSMLFWPYMNHEIKDKVKNCDVCAKFKTRNCKEPLIPHIIPELPWEKIGVDIFEYKSKNYLVAKDYYSKWIECLELKNGKTSDDVINCLKIMFGHFGIPKIVVSDNVPFNSFQFVTFSKEYNFELVFSSPRYPQSNGMSESGVKVAKKLLKKSIESKSDFFVAMLNYNNTPVGNLKYSPAQLLQGRMMRSKIPVSINLLKPIQVKNAKSELTKMKMQQKKVFDKTAKLSEVLVGDSELVRLENSWKKGKWLIFIILPGLTL